MGKKVEYEGSSVDAKPIRINFKNPIKITDVGTFHMNCGVEYIIGENINTGEINEFDSDVREFEPEHKFRYIEVGLFPFDALERTKRTEAKLYIAGEE